MLGLPCALLAAATLSACAASPAQLPAQAGATSWTLPATLSDCGGEDAQVAFPSDAPSSASGPGAVVWSASATCDSGAGARVAQVNSADLPRAGVSPTSAAGQALALTAPLAVSGAPHGLIAIAGTAADDPGVGRAIEGPAGGPFTVLAPTAGFSAPFALARGYLGDVALAAPSHSTRGAGGALALHVERYFGASFTRNQRVAARAGALQALAVALDYRTDALVAWAHAGALYVRALPGRGPARPLQRLARVGSHLSVAAILSDDYRGIVVWSEQRGTQTSVYLDQSAVGLRFGAPQLLERFQDADGLSAPAGSPRLIRLSNESVMLAWAGVAAGHWVVRAASIDQHGVGTPSTIAAPGTDALLCDLAPGPAGDALVMWAEPQQREGAGPDLAEESLFAARGVNERPRRAIFEAPEEVAPPGELSEVSLALDPASDRALAVWRSEGGALQYAVRSAGAEP